MATYFDEDDLTWTPEEMESFAEDELISIIPNFSIREDPQSKLHLIGGDYGPFQPNVSTQVPLWLALDLQERKRCRIMPPDWLEPSRLKEALQLEEEHPAVFQPLPFHYLEIAHSLLKHAKKTFPDSKTVQMLVQQLQKMRMEKIQAGLEVLSGPMMVKMNNLSAIEINHIRPFFLGCLDYFNRLSKMEQPFDAGLYENDASRANTQAAPRRQLRRGD